MVREDAKNAFYRTSPLWVFSSFSTVRRSTDEARQSALGLRQCSLLLQTVRSVNAIFAVFLYEGHPSVAHGPPQGARRSALGLRQCSLLLQTVRSVNAIFAVFLYEGHPSVAHGAPQGAARSAHR
jgi:hypothetical protein